MTESSDLSPEQIEAFARKLVNFAQSLEEREQELLVELVHRAAAVPDEVTGYDLGLFVTAGTMRETEMSFGLQYLALQSQMQSQNRAYTAVSNIMKTKHDTVKNSISNIR